MIGKSNTKRENRQRRQKRVRAKMCGTVNKPRLCVSRSLHNVFVQLIDDEKGKTLVGVNSRGIKIGDAGKRKGKTALAYLTGKALAEKAKSLKIKSIVFDRAGFKYHGRVQAVAEGAREGGLEF
jgi:large subunit ribosomal protein L18